MTWSGGAGAAGSFAAAVAATGTALTATASRPRGMRTFTVGPPVRVGGESFNQNRGGGSCQAPVILMIRRHGAPVPQHRFESGSEQRNVRDYLRPFLRAGPGRAAGGA